MSAKAKKTAFLLAGSTALSIIYYFAAVAGLRFDPVSGFATLIWPPTGIALAALFLLGPEYAPAVALGAFAANYATGAPPLIALGIAIGNTGEAYLGSYLLRRSGFRPEMNRLKDAFVFIFQAAVVSTLVSPTIGTFSLWLGGVVAPPAIVRTWTTWWIGDALGALVIGAMLIVLAGVRWRKPVFGPVAYRKIAEGFALAVTLLAACVFAFAPLQVWTGELPIVYVVFIPLLWAALRFGQVGAVISTFTVATLAVWGTVNGGGPFARATLGDSLLFLQFFTAVVAAITMLMASLNLERKRAEEVAKGFNRELAKQVDDKTRQLTEAVQELSVTNAAMVGAAESVKALDTLKTKFIQIIAHQMRTPLSAIRWNQEVMLEDAENLSPENVALIRSNLEVLGTIIKSVHNLFVALDIEEGKMTLERKVVDLQSIVHSVLEEQTEQCARRGLRCSFIPGYASGAALIHGDIGKLRSVVEALVENAVLYSKEGGVVRADVKKIDRKFRIEVSDEGVGIHPAEQPNIFTRFFRASNAEVMLPDASGLSLYIAKHYVEAHGGKIGFTSELGKGSTFWVELPAK